ncbi:MAG: glycine cleavage system aminomethyltransferase GcvT [Candidatus Eisenbacteria bacterium]
MSHTEQSNTPSAKETPLTGRHRELGAKLVEFAGWLMPVQYTGLLDEHKAVREAVGLFDVSHMGEVWLSGPGAVAAANRLVTNEVSSLRERQVLYTPMCYENGGIVDDVLVYRVGDDVLLVVNASNMDKDQEWIRSHVPGGVSVENRSLDTVQVALQGPRTEEVLKAAGLSALIPLKHNEHARVSVRGMDVLASRTGYTGEDGFEFYHDAKDGGKLWDLLLEAGKPAGIKPIGLGARDTLRFEMGYCLYGNEIDGTTTPLEAGLGWTVKLDKSDFIGREALVAQKAAGLGRRLVGLEMLDTAIPRKGYPVASRGREVGHVTSGTFSPSLEKGFALAYVRTEDAKPGTELFVSIRGRESRAVVTTLPFYKRGSRK